MTQYSIGPSLDPRKIYLKFFVREDIFLKLCFIEIDFYIFFFHRFILDLCIPLSFYSCKDFFKDFRLTFPTIFRPDRSTPVRECNPAREIPLARASVHSLFPSSWSRAIPPLCGVSLWTRVRCPRSFSSHLSSWIPHLSFSLSSSFARFRDRTRVSACVHACVRSLLFFSAPVANAADVRRRRRVSERQVSDTPRLIERSPVPLIDLPVAATTALLFR